MHLATWLSDAIWYTGLGVWLFGALIAIMLLALEIIDHFAAKAAPAITAAEIDELPEP